LTILIIDSLEFDMTDMPWYDEIALPALLRHARKTYGSAMRRALDDAGYDDIPANGLYLIGGLALRTRDVPLGQLIRELEISKQAAGVLVDTLVMRGYLARTVDPDDRRKLSVGLTERGSAAAAVQTTARERIDAKLLAKVGAHDADAARRALAALVDIGMEEREAAKSD
jgi:DNA-binding MarR family transcriptional regulator